MLNLLIVAFLISKVACIACYLANPEIVGGM